MKCPFLRTASVKYCEVSAYRKMLLTTSTDTPSERCSTPKYPECPAAAQRLANTPRSEHCPFLHLSQAEYCAAASVTKYVPATNDLLSRCNSDGHLYCELFLAHADPTGERRPRVVGARQAAAAGERTPSVDGIPVPSNLAYAANHMWLDVGDDGFCHVGIDGFAAKVIGSAEKVTFVNSRMVGRPVAVLTVNGVDLQMVFPNPLHLSAANAYLRTTPDKVTADPYGAGWLFEGFEPVGETAKAGSAVREGLVSGDHAVAWMRAEVARLNEFVHERATAPGNGGERFMADGGAAIDGIASHLDRDALLNLITEFFAPQLTWRRSW